MALRAGDKVRLFGGEFVVSEVSEVSHGRERYMVLADFGGRYAPGSAYVCMNVPVPVNGCQRIPMVAETHEVHERSASLTIREDGCGTLIGRSFTQFRPGDLATV